jgi:simple sugar transport system permease protein
MIYFLAIAMAAATPLLFATLGELLAEKSGSLNLGIEGMMLIGAVMGFSTVYSTHSPILGLIAAFISGGVGGLIFAILTVTFQANQVVTGLTLTIFGTGFSSFVGDKMIGLSVPHDAEKFFDAVRLPILGDIPILGPIFFQQDIFVYLGYVVVVVISIYLYKTRPGLNLQAVGENTAAADASGIPVYLYK